MVVEGIPACTLRVVSSFPIFCPLVFPSCRIANMVIRYGPGAASLTYSFLNGDDVDETGEPDPASVDLVANIEGEFTLRKLSLKFDRDAGTGATDDSAYTGFHIVKLTAGLPDDEWVAGDFTDIEALVDTWWDAIKVFYRSGTVLKQMRWYRVEPGELLGPPVRVLDVTVPGTADAFAQLPPQVAISITEKTSDPKSWGRIYLPSPASTILSGSNNGRMATADAGTIADATDALYEAMITAGTPIVVYSAAKPVRSTAGGSELPAIAARALGVTSIQVDDIFDVIRSRRWKTPLLKTQRDVAGA